MNRPNEICRKCTGRTCHEPFQCHGYPQGSDQADRIRLAREALDDTQRALVSKALAKVTP